MMPGWINRAIDGIERVLPARVPGAMSKLSTRLRRPLRLMTAAVQSSNLAFLATDINGIITGWNQSAERLFGYSANEAIGCGTEMLVPDDRRHQVETIRGKFRAGERIDNMATVRLGKGGKPIHVVLDISPLQIAGAQTRIKVAKVVRESRPSAKGEGVVVDRKSVV